MKEYSWEERTDSLRKLGFANYPQYLRSELWRQIKEAKLNEAPERGCEACGGDAIDVHHVQYHFRTMSGNDPGSLFALCRSCHSEIHARGADGRLPSLGEAGGRLFMMIIPRWVWIELYIAEFGVHERFGWTGSNACWA